MPVCRVVVILRQRCPGHAEFHRMDVCKAKKVLSETLKSSNYIIREITRAVQNPHSTKEKLSTTHCKVG